MLERLKEIVASRADSINNSSDPKATAQKMLFDLGLVRDKPSEIGRNPLDLSVFGALTELASDQPNRVNLAVRSLYETSFATIEQFVVNNGGTVADSQDLFQDLIISLMERSRIEDFEARREMRIGTYLYQMAKNMWFRKLRNRNLSDARISAYFNDMDLTEDLNTQENFDGLERLILADEERFSLYIFRKLSSEAQQLLTAFYSDRLSFQEIAKRFSYPSIQSVKAHRTRAMKELSLLIRSMKIDE